MFFLNHGYFQIYKSINIIFKEVVISVLVGNRRHVGEFIYSSAYEDIWDRLCKCQASPRTERQEKREEHMKAGIRPEKCPPDSACRSKGHCQSQESNVEEYALFFSYSPAYVWTTWCGVMARKRNAMSLSSASPRTCTSHCYSDTEKAEHRWNQQGWRVSSIQIPWKAEWMGKLVCFIVCFFVYP